MKFFHHPIPDFWAYLGIELWALVVGIGLVVIIKCYPAYLDRGWRQDCLEFLELPPPETRPVGLFSPLFACLQCHSNYFWLKGRCPHCRHWPLWPLWVVVLSIVGSLGVFMHFGYTYDTLWFGLLTYALIVLAFIDYQEQFLPDDITLGFLWIGLLLNTQSLFTTPVNAILGAAIPYISIFALAQLTRLVRKKHGIGLGDFKMISMIGAWVGLYQLFLPLVLAFAAQIVLIIALYFIRSHTGRLIEFKFSFGPALALATWVSLYFLH